MPPKSRIKNALSQPPRASIHSCNFGCEWTTRVPASSNTCFTAFSPKYIVRASANVKQTCFLLSALETILKLRVLQVLRGYITEARWTLFHAFVTHLRDK